MNPGSQAFPAAIDDTPAKRSSLTMRSCNVPKARSMRSMRSMRPFACGLLAQMMSMQERATELRHTLAIDDVLAVHPEDAVLVAVERDRLPCSSR